MSTSDLQSSSAGSTPSGVSIVTIDSLARNVGATVVLRGWLYNRRSSGKVHFLEVRDGTGMVQCVMGKNDVDEATFAAADHLSQETSVEITGLVKAHPKRPNVFEVAATGLRVLGKPSGEYPISPKEHGTDFLMDNRHLWLRSKRQHAILRVRHTIIRTIRDYFDGLGFTLVDAPIFTPNACEGTSTLFETDYHGDKAYLTQSGQLYMEAAAAAVGKAYCFGPTFRAEKSKTRRHLAEFWMVEPEVAFMDLDGDMDLAEGLLVALADRVLTERREELAILERDTSKLETVKRPFPRIRYDQAVAIINEHRRERRAKGETNQDGSPVEDFPWGEDFGGEDETVVSNRYDRPVMVHRYPAEVKAFYLKRDPEDARLALGVDVLAPEGYGEVIGGGQREDDLATLEAAIEHHKLPKEAFEWYLDLRRYGSFPHAGFGLGVERSVAWLCGLPHVRETIPFPRMLSRLAP
ncbi:MAG: asparagine--tRNA ligase [Polyangiaceae bacterium]|nr:asparagine--tRNA ligase [Polyangiaceae bacterium]